MMMVISVSKEKDTSQKFVILDFSEMKNRQKILKCFRKEKRDFRWVVLSVFFMKTCSYNIIL